MENKNFLSTKWYWEHWCGDILLSTWEYENLCPLEGRNYMLDSALSGGTPITTFYIALLDVNHTPDAADTYANSMGTANYESTDYSESARPTWADDGVSAGSITNSTLATFTMGGNDTTIYGAALVSVATKGDSGTGVLMGIGLFPTAMSSIVAGNVLKCGVTVSMTST